MGILDFKAMRAMAEQKCREIEIELPLDMEAGECSVGQQQMTEIVRNLLLDAKVVIMDEPTAALTERETEKLFEVMRSLKKTWCSNGVYFAPYGRGYAELRHDYRYA